MAEIEDLLKKKTLQIEIGVDIPIQKKMFGGIASIKGTSKIVIVELIFVISVTGIAMSMLVYFKGANFANPLTQITKFAQHLADAISLTKLYI